MEFNKVQKSCEKVYYDFISKISSPFYSKIQVTINVILQANLLEFEESSVQIFFNFLRIFVTITLLRIFINAKAGYFIGIRHYKDTLPS